MNISQNPYLQADNTHLFTRLFMEYSPEGSSKNIKHQETRLLTRVLKQQTKKGSTRMGFEPTRAEHIGLAVQRLNHSATSSTGTLSVTGVVLLFFYGGHFQFPDFLLIYLPINYFKLGKKKKYTETALIKPKYMIFLIKNFLFRQC